MAALNSIRWAVTKHLVDLIKGQDTIGAATVHPGWPGDKPVTAELIWVDELEGDLNVPTMKAGRKHRDDLFRVPFQIRVASQKHSLDLTMTRLSEIIAAIEDIPADFSTLEDFDGVVDAQVIRERMTSGMTPEGALGFGEVVVEVHARLT